MVFVLMNGCKRIEFVLSRLLCIYLYLYDQDLEFHLHLNNYPSSILHGLYYYYYTI